MKLSAASALAALVALAPLAARAAVPAYVTSAIADPARPKADVASDKLRDPADTIAFAGVKPGMTIAELFPGGGYYTRMLADIVGPKGHIVGIENAGWKGAVKADQAMLAEPGHTRVQLDVETFGNMTVPEPVDLFWITQNYHDLKVAQFGQVDMAAFNRKVFDALKPGGVYFILDHQANPGITPEQIGKLHRVEKAQVIKEVTAAGFKLVAEGKFLNRTGDDHTKPIFDLHGETDQYALKFVKPRA
jgi:predicted methyltransferase